MTTDIQKIIEDAMRLDPNARALIVETLLESLEGKRGLPRHRPPFPAEAGLFGRPTLVHNVETVYWVRDIVEKGAEWAKANLTVADFNLVQRYLDVYEQLTFRCQEQIDIVAVDEQDDDDEEEGGDAVDRRPPPFPDRRPNSLAKSSLPKHVERAKTVPAKSTATN